MEGCTGQAWLRTAILFLHYIYPPLTLLYFVLTRTVSAFSLPVPSPVDNGRSITPGFTIWFTLGVVSTYAGEAILVLTQESALPSGRVTRDLIIYTLSASVVWSIQAVSLITSKHADWYPYYGCWAIAVAAEILLTIFEHKSCAPIKASEFSQLEIQVIRICALALLLGLFFSARKSGGDDTQVDEESQSLLAGTPPVQSRTTGDGSQSLVKDQANSYGTVQIAGTAKGTADDTQSRKGPVWRTVLDKAKGYKKAPGNSKSSATWRSTAGDIWNLFLFVWPTGNLWVQLSFIGIGLCVLAGRVLKVLVLYELGRIVDILSTRPGRLPWVEISRYVLYRWLDSSAGLGALKRLLWAPVEEQSYKSINIAAFAHLMELSSDSYEHSRSRKVLESVNYGRTITRLVDVGTLEAIPTSIDLFVIIGFLWLLFDAYLALTVALVTVTYLWMTSSLYKIDKYKRGVLSKSSEWETKLIRQVINGWQTVLVNNRTGYEMKRYSNAIETHARALQKSRISHCVLLAIQSSITCIGLLAASMLAAKQVARGEKPLRNLVILLAYWAGMSGTLYSIGLNWRCLKDDLVVAKGLLTLFRTRPTVKHSKTAQRLKLDAGEVRFEDVSFGYGSGNLILENISFQARPSQRVALVGMPESGKSTILKLLFRLYDVTSGKIEIDGQDIREVTIESLRDQIAVVSKDCELFNDSILNNIRYARLGSPDQEVFDACAIAGIHESILSFSDGYHTKVGEHGFTLSGSDLRRISIARALLKDPSIILLDESTSITNDETEKQIQSATDQLTRHRTTLIAARQQSTMMDVDHILVLRDGKIAEQGYHTQLLRKKGLYHRMWRTHNATKDLIDNDNILLVDRAIEIAKEHDEVEDNSLQMPSPDLVHKAEAVVQNDQSKTAVAHDLSQADQEAATVLEDYQRKTAVIHGLGHAIHEAATVLEDSLNNIAAVQCVSNTDRKTASVLEDSQSKTAAVKGLGDANHKTASVLEDLQNKKAVAHDLNDANRKPATVEDSQSKKAVVYDLSDANQRAPAVFGDNYIKNAVAHYLGQTEAKGPVVKMRNSLNDEPEKEITSAQDKSAKGKGRWKPEAPEFIPRNMHVLISNKDWLSKGKGLIRDMKPVGRQDQSKPADNTHAHERITQKEHKIDTGIAFSVKKDEVRQNLSDITNGKSSVTHNKKTVAVRGQLDVDKGPASVIQHNRVERKIPESDDNKKGGDKVDDKDKITEVKSDMVNGKISTPELERIDSKQNQSDHDQETGKAVILNDNDHEPNQPDIGQTKKPSEEKEVQAVVPGTHSFSDQVHSNNNSTDPNVKQPKRRSRNRNNSFKRRQKSTSEESASQLQKETTKDSSNSGTSLGAESTKVDKPQEVTTNPAEKDKGPEKPEVKPEVKRVRFRRGPQTQSEPSREGNNEGTKGLRSSMRAFRGHSPGEHDRRESASSDIPSTTTGQSGRSSGKRRQHFKNWKAKKRDEQRRSGSESTGSAGGEIQKEGAKSGDKAASEKPVASETTMAKDIEVGKEKPITSGSQGPN